MERPGPLRWLWYAMGGGLRPAHRRWVLHDLTVRTWRLQQPFRSIVQILPVAVLEEATEHRALKAGFARAP
jgi:hypothetical protein